MRCLGLPLVAWASVVPVNPLHSLLKWLLNKLLKLQWNMVFTVEVFVKVLDPGREAAIRALQAAGLEVTSIKDVTNSSQWLSPSKTVVYNSHSGRFDTVL